MRVSVMSTLALLSAGILGCDGQPLTGPEAQRAFSEATSTHKTVPGNAIVFIDGVRLESGASLDLIRPADIERIEVIKRAVAARLHGEEARNGVIHIYLKKVP